MKTKCEEYANYKKHNIKTNFGFISATCGHYCKVNELKENCKKFCAINWEELQKQKDAVIKKHMK